MTLKEIAGFLQGELHGAENIEITGPGKIESAVEGQITFVSNPKYYRFLKTTNASAVLIDKPVENLNKPHIIVKDAYVGFLMLLKLFSPEQHQAISGISEKAYIDTSAIIADNVKIAPLVYIGPGVEVGTGTVLYPGTILLENVRVGSETVLYPNVSVRENCVIGDRVILHNGCVIGSDGFGFAPKEGQYIKIPQIGNVVIEDDVELGANTTVDRATVGSTVIKKGTKIDNLVQIAHNVVVGEHNAMASQVGISGSSQTGNHVTLGGQVGISGHIRLGHNVTIAAQSGVAKDVPDGEILFGSPALPFTVQKRINVVIKQLPELLKRIREMEKEIEKLKEGK